MKKVLAAAALTALAAFFGLLPFQRHDAGQLLPVQTIWFDRCGGQVTVCTDGGLSGSGADLQEALSDLQSTAAGYVYFATASRVLVTERAADLPQQAWEEDTLRPGTRVYHADPDAVQDLDAATELLTAAEREKSARAVTISDLAAAELENQTVNLPRVFMENGRLAVENE